MKIRIDFDTSESNDLIALKAMFDALVGVDQGSGPLKEFDPAKVAIWSTNENGDFARQNVNLDDSVGDVELKTIPKGRPKPKKGEVVVATGVEPTVDVETKDVKVENVSIDDALDQLDPPPPKEKVVDQAAELRKLMVEVVKAHGPKGAKLASQTVSKIAGIKDVSKIPADKFEAVKAGLQAVIASTKETPAKSETPATSESDVSLDDIHY